MYPSYSLSVPRDVPDVRSDVVVFLAACAVCLLFRLPTLGDLPLWYDEIITADSIQMSWGRMARERLSQGHFPTYFALLKALGFAGSSEWALRLPSAILDCVAGGMIAVMARRIGGMICAIATAVLYATCPILIIYAQEARPYALQLLFIALAMFGHIALLRSSDRLQPWHAKLATVGTLGAILTIPASVVIVALQHIGLLVCGVTRRGEAERRMWISHFSVTWIVAFISSLLLVRAVWKQAVAPRGLMKWNKGTTFLDRMYEIISRTYGFDVPSDSDRFLPHQSNIGLMVGLLFLMAIGFWVNRRSRVTYYLAVPAIGTVFVFGLISFFAAITSRYLIGMMPAAILLAALGAAALLQGSRTRWIAMPFIALFCVGVVLQGGDTAVSPRKYDWRPVVNFLHDKGFRDGSIHSDYFVINKELRYYAGELGSIDYVTVMKGFHSIEELWRKASGLPVTWFVLTEAQSTPPSPTPTAVACNWSFGKMKVIMVARDRSLVPASLAAELADPKVCSLPG